MLWIGAEKMFRLTRTILKDYWKEEKITQFERPSKVFTERSASSATSNFSDSRSDSVLSACKQIVRSQQFTETLLTEIEY